jgi:hypothetical protein
MDRLNITTKIWLCGLIFVVGFLFTTTLDQIGAVRTEAALDATSSALFPAAQQSQTAASAFQQAVKAFSDAVLVQDTARLDAAAERPRRRGVAADDQRDSRTFPRRAPGHPR